jgi:hypothetical protein
MLLTSGNSPDSTANGCAYRFLISKSKSGKAGETNGRKNVRQGCSHTHPTETTGTSTGRYLGDLGGPHTGMVRKHVGQRVIWVKLR